MRSMTNGNLTNSIKFLRGKSSALTQTEKQEVEALISEMSDLLDNSETSTAKIKRTKMAGGYTFESIRGSAKGPKCKMYFEQQLIAIINQDDTHGSSNANTEKYSTKGFSALSSEEFERHEYIEQAREEIKAKHIKKTG